MQRQGHSAQEQSGVLEGTECMDFTGKKRGILICQKILKNSGSLTVIFNLAPLLGSSSGKKTALRMFLASPVL